MELATPNCISCTGIPTPKTAHAKAKCFKPLLSSAVRFGYPRLQIFEDMHGLASLEHPEVDLMISSWNRFWTFFREHVFSLVASFFSDVPNCWRASFEGVEFS